MANRSTSAYLESYDFKDIRFLSLLIFFIQSLIRMKFTFYFIFFIFLVNSKNSEIHAQAYPDKPIKLVVPTGAGGPTDMIARLLADRIRIDLAQSIIIDNRVGAGGAVGAKFVAQSAPDGYTLLFGNTATLANIPAVSKGAGYDPMTSFSAVARTMDSYQVLVISPDLPVNSVAELIQYLRANPSKMNFSAAGVGNLTHLSGELFKYKTNTNFEIIQYKSGAESINSIISGQTQFTIDNISVVKPFIQDKRLKALAVTSSMRKFELPDVPTMQESGINDLVITSFFGVVAPIGTPKLIIQKLNKSINEELKSDFMIENLKRIGGQVVQESPEQFQFFIGSEIKKWTTLANSTNIKID